MPFQKVTSSRPWSIWIGFDKRGARPSAYAVTCSSARRRLTAPIPIRGVVLDQLREQGLYYRPTKERLSGGDTVILHDVISDAPMATEFAVSRFLVPHLAGTGWALFMDGDMLVRENLVRLFELADPNYAVMCVKHKHEPAPGSKMDRQIQTNYSRKNWSSVVFFNCDHPSNKRLSWRDVNNLPGRDLHRFYWLEDNEIGELPATWNWLAGYSDPIPELGPAVVHHTDGSPNMPGYEKTPYAEEWWQELQLWAEGNV